jgi:hypothetical protein
MRKNLVNTLTFFALFLGLILAAIWLLRSEADSRFEPALTVLGLFATLTGIFAERQASDYERKRELLLAFYGELVKNKEILQDSQFNLQPDQLEMPVVFPRLISSVTETAIASGVFEEQKYREVFSYLNKWRDTVNAFNHRLYITELRTFTNPVSGEIRSFYRGLINSGQIDEALQLNRIIADNLRLKYLKGISVGTLNSIQRDFTVSN